MEAVRQDKSALLEDDVCVFQIVLENNAVLTDVMEVVEHVQQDKLAMQQDNVFHHAFNDVLEDNVVLTDAEEFVDLAREKRFAIL